MELYLQKILAIRDEAPTIRTFRFAVPLGLTWEEGAHLHIAFPDFNAGGIKNPERVRHMSIASLPRENVIAITTRLNDSSPFKQALAALTVGDEMVLYKFGSRLALRREERPIVLLSMGVGLAAFRPLILEYVSDSRGIPSLTSLTRCRPGQELYRDELSALSHSQLHQEWHCAAESFLQAVDSQPLDGWYYIVGSEIFIRDMIRVLRGRGIADEAMIIDKKPPVRAMFFQTMELISEKPLLVK